jgi:hypothetical protein
MPTVRVESMTRKIVTAFTVGVFYERGVNGKCGSTEL